MQRTGEHHPSAIGEVVATFGSMLSLRKTAVANAGGAAAERCPCAAAETSAKRKRAANNRRKVAKHDDLLGRERGTGSPSLKAAYIPRRG